MQRVLLTTGFEVCQRSATETNLLGDFGLLQLELLATGSRARDPSSL